VATYDTILEDDVRLGYGSMISAGCRIGENAMVGASATTRGDVPAHHIAVGTPAKSVTVKPGWETVADDPCSLADNRERRQIGLEVPNSLDEFDEFDRNLSPPGES
jgi:maltose O-acetyltransferase